MPASIEEDRRIRQEAIAWLTVRTNDGRDPISTADLDDFAVDRRPFRIKDRQQGIWKPAAFRAALSIQTMYRADGPAHDAQPPVRGVGSERWTIRLRRLTKSVELAQEAE